MIPALRCASRLSLLLLLVALLLVAPGCRRSLSPEEKATRAELRQALREHSYEKAEKLARQVVAQRPRENGAWERLVRAQLGTNDLEAARESLLLWRKAVRRLSPKHDELTGDLAAKEDDHAAAAQAWSRSLTADSSNTRVMHKLARAYRRLNRPADEDAVLTKLLEREDDGAVRMERALCRRRLHRWTEALDDYRVAQELAPDDLGVRRGAKLFERLTKFLAEIRQLDARLAVTPGDDQLLTDRALLFLRSEDPELGLEDSTAAAQLAPWAVRPRLFQAAALISLERPEAAEQLGVNRTLRLDALSPEFLETISRLDAEISVERKNPDLYIARAWQLNEIQQPGLALADAAHALQHDPNSAAAHVESSYALTKLGRAEEGFEHIRKATEIDENYSTAWHYRGELEMSRGDYAAAVQSLTRAIAINQTAAALKKREESYRQLGLITEADADLRAYEAMNARSSSM
jgi:tetratricopeptide (TPR) repeat protein